MKDIIVNIEIVDLSCDFPSEDVAIVKLAVKAISKQKEIIKVGKKEVMQILASGLEKLILVSNKEDKQEG